MAANVDTSRGHVEPTRADVRRKRDLWRSPKFLAGYEIVLVLVGYWLYSLVRNAVRAHETEAVQHARQVVNIERLFGIYQELPLNHFVAHQEWLAYLCNYYYATLHFVITIAVGVWVYRRRHWYGRRLRNTWYLMNCFALLGFAFYSLAPPRLLPGGQFADTVVTYRTWGSWGNSGVAEHSNQYAAMPSMHIGWSLWVGITVYRLANRQWVRLLGIAYPVATLFVIVGTGNHYFLDAVGGAVALGLAFFVQLLISHRPVFAPPPTPAFVAPLVRVTALGDTATAAAKTDDRAGPSPRTANRSGADVPGRATYGQRTSDENDLPVRCQ
ncbi:MAG: phosphatase PAP2 family protein [Frankiaceae bacterium]